MININQHFTANEQVNYIAVSVLEQLELKNPSAEQVEIMEKIFQLAVDPKNLHSADIEQCVGDDFFAKSIFRCYLAERLFGRQLPYNDLTARHTFRVALKTLAYQLNDIATYRIANTKGDDVDCLIAGIHRQLDDFQNKQGVFEF